MCAECHNTAEGRGVLLCTNTNQQQSLNKCMCIASRQLRPFTIFWQNTYSCCSSSSSYYATHLLVEASEGQGLPKHGVNFAAKSLEDPAELQCDVTAAQHCNLLGLLGKLKCLI